MGDTLSGEKNGSIMGKTLQLLTLTYLGLFLTTRMTFSNALNEMANKARKGLLTYSERYGGLGIFRHQYFSISLMLKLSRCSCMVQKFGV